jgi:YLP motif-containing protein 1
MRPTFCRPCQPWLCALRRLIPSLACAQEAAGRSGDQAAEEEPAFRIGGAAAGAPAKAGLEVVHLLHGLGPPAELEDGTPGVAPHPGSTPQRGRGGFAAAARAEHQTEADLFRRLLLSRTGGGA